MTSLLTRKTDRAAAATAICSASEQTPRGNESCLRAGVTRPSAGRTRPLLGAVLSWTAATGAVCPGAGPRPKRTTLSDSIRSDPSGAALAVADPNVRANKLELLERLADALAHEIKNPLHSMVINLEVLKRRLSRVQEGAEVLRYATVLGEELERVNRRIELLLRLSRPDRGGGADETTLNEMLEEVMELVMLEARNREARVEYDSQGALARVRVGRQHARQVILNLVLDALDALGPGDTLRLQVRTAEGRAELTVSGGSSVEPGERTVVAAALAEAVGGRVDVEGATRTLALPSHGVQ
jgi:signal transduction histidine kinase